VCKNDSFKNRLCFLAAYKLQCYCASREDNKITYIPTVLKKCFTAVYAKEYFQIKVCFLTQWKTAVSDLIHLQDLHRIN
jgi:hypothetical protein